MNRDEFLRRVRDAAAAKSEPYTRPVVPIASVPRVRFLGDDAPAPLTQIFVERAERAGAKVHRTKDCSATVDQLVAGAECVLLGADPDCARLTLGATPFIRTDTADRDAMASADVAVTGCEAAIAQTGSVVLSSRWGRSAGLLPPRHVAIVRASAVVATPGDFLRRLGRAAAALPSAYVVVTGPSRSADIEHKLTIGVHGPGTLDVVLLEDR